MAILGLFTKKSKAKPTSSQTSSSSAVTPDDGASSESYVLSPPSGVVPSLGNGCSDYASSSASLVSGPSSPKKNRFGFSKKSPAPAAPTNILPRPYGRPSGDGKLSTDKLSLDLASSYGSSQLKPSVLPSFHQANSAPSLGRSSIFDASDRPDAEHVQKAASAQPGKSSGGLFGWRERKKSKPQKPEIVLPPLSDDSFNLKSFRHVGPQSTPDSSGRSESPAQTSPQSLIPPARPRPRGSSMASTDSSQRISVAAFREAQARRSSTNLASASPSPTIRPVSAAGSVASIPDMPLSRPRPPRTPGSASASPARDARSVPGHGPMMESSSSDSSEEESESEDYSPSRSRSRLSRQRTVTKKSYRASSDLGHATIRPGASHHQQSSSTRSELGHGSHTRAQASPSRGPPPSAFQKTYDATVGTRSFSLYRREQASHSTSDLNPNAAAQRASVLLEANKRDTQAARESSASSNSSDSSSSSDSSDEDAPLVALKRPPLGSRADSSQSNSSSQARKPLIDLNSKSNPITGKPLAEPAAAGAMRGRARPTLMSPTDINGRLSRLTAEAGLGNHRKNSASKSEDNLSRDADPSTPTLQTDPKLISPVSSATVTPPLRTTSPEPLTPMVSKAIESVASAPAIGPRSSYEQSNNVQREQPRNAQAGSSDLRASPAQDKLKPPIPLHPTQTSSPSPRPNVITPGIRTSSLSYTSSVFSDSSSARQMDELRPVPVKTRSEDNHGFRVVSRPQKSDSTTTSPSTTSSDFQSTQTRERPAFNPSHRATPSSSSTRSQNTIPAIKTVPLTSTSQASSSKHASPSMATPSASRPAQTLQSPPHRAFLSNGKRTDSPASSTGGSSNGKAPLTPMDGSDYFIPDVRRSSDSPSSSSVSATPPSAMKGGRGHVKRGSVSFEESTDFDNDKTVRGRRSGGLGGGKNDDMTIEERENRLRERRRSEAKAAIELGNVINGRGPAIEVEDGDEDAIVGASVPSGLQPGAVNFGFNNMMGWQQQGMAGAMTNGMNGMNLMPGTPGMGMGMPQQPFLFPPPMAGTDPVFLAAHQQAMLIAKQTYQMAVAQQAMAAAADEWERGSSVSAYTGPSGLGMGVSPNGYGMGMNGMWSGSGQMFPGAPRSMYAGSTYGGAMSDAGWGAASVYGEPFGPSMPAASRRSQVMGGQSGNVKAGVAFPGAKRSESANDINSPSSRNAPRPRTRTAPSNAPLPAQHRNGRAPPSSWRV